MPEPEPDPFDAMVNEEVQRQMADQFGNPPEGVDPFDPYQEPDYGYEDESGPEEVVQSVDWTDEDQKAMVEQAEANSAFYAASPLITEAINALAEEYGTAYARSVLRSPEARAELLEMLGGSKRFRAEGEAIKARAGLHRAGPPKGTPFA
jgi:hypothetical protein